MQLVPETEDGVSIIDTNADGAFQPVPEKPGDGCWTAADEVIFTDELQSAVLAACESVTETFTVVGHPTNESCPPEGTYRIGSTWQIYDESGEPGEEFTWEITLGLSSSRTESERRQRSGE